MKIRCHCGNSIIDQTDNLPCKGRLIPDQEWFRIFDAIDVGVIDRMADGGLDREEACMMVRRIISGLSRPMWQCRQCGRIYIDDRNGNLQCYLPAAAETDKEILRSGE